MKLLKGQPELLFLHRASVDEDKELARGGLWLCATLLLLPLASNGK